MADKQHDPKLRFRTRAVHGSQPRLAPGDALVTPIYQCSTYLLGEPESFDDIRYIRLNNTPNHRSVASRLASLEGTEAAVVTPSGTAAISVALGTHLAAGDHAIVQHGAYSGTLKILGSFEKRYGVSVTYVRGDDPGAWQRALRPETKVLYVESLTNPLLEVGELEGAAAFARDHGLISMIDNTFPTPVNFRPRELGFELVIHSASKYLNGHTDIVAGVVAGPRGRICAIRKHMNLHGVCLDPGACYLLERGLKTLAVRVPAQNESAGALARALKAHPAVRMVRYPGLEDDPSHARASRFFDGYGAMITFAPAGGSGAAERFMERLRLAWIAPSLGGAETLVCRPVTTLLPGLEGEARDGTGMTDDLVRISVGLEDSRDLIADFEAALAN